MTLSRSTLLALLATTSQAIVLNQQPFLDLEISTRTKTIAQPLIGFGTWNLDTSPENTTAAVSFAIQSGYRQIDCAAIYRNEKEVGKGIADGLEKTGLKREEIWVTSKLWNDHHGDDPALAEAALNKTLEDLGLDYLDLYLMHWPVGIEPDTKSVHFDYVETWKSMITLPKSKVLNIGISNFAPAQLEEIISETGVTPFAHQMELHPYLQQSSWVATHKALGISVTAYSPLGHSTAGYHGQEDELIPLLKNDVVVDIAAQKNCTAAQVVLSWGMGRGTSVIPKSSHQQWILENLAASKCELGYRDLARLRIMGRKFLTRFINPSKSWGLTLFEGLDGI